MESVENSDELNSIYLKIKSSKLFNNYLSFFNKVFNYLGWLTLENEKYNSKLEYDNFFLEISLDTDKKNYYITLKNKKEKILMSEKSSVKSNTQSIIKYVYQTMLVVNQRKNTLSKKKYNNSIKIKEKANV